VEVEMVVAGDEGGFDHGALRGVLSQRIGGRRGRGNAGLAAGSSTRQHFVPGGRLPAITRTVAGLQRELGPGRGRAEGRVEAFAWQIGEETPELVASRAAAPLEAGPQQPPGFQRPVNASEDAG